jgi:hypothetical protein
VDLGRVAYYRVVVMLRWLVSVVAALERGGIGMDRSVYYRLVPVLSVRLPRALAGLLGVELPPRPDGPDDPPGPAADVIDTIGRDIARVIAPAVHEPEARRRIDASTFYLSHLAAMDRHGATLARAELDDLAEVLGGRPRSSDEGRRDLAELARRGSARPDLLAFFWRDGARQVAAWPLVASRAFTEPTALATLAFVVHGRNEHAEKMAGWLAKEQQATGVVGVRSGEPAPGWRVSPFALGRPTCSCPSTPPSCATRPSSSSTNHSTVPTLGLTCSPASRIGGDAPRPCGRRRNFKPSRAGRPFAVSPNS